MCIICIDLVRNNISSMRALKNYSENIEEYDDKHSRRLLELVSMRKAVEDEEEKNKEIFEEEGKSNDD